MGAEINGGGTDLIQVNGVKELKGSRYKVMPDRIETGTYMAAVAITGGDLLIKNTNPHFVVAMSAVLDQIGVVVKEIGCDMRVMSEDSLKPTNIVTGVYPGFPTDLQPIMTSLLSMAKGTSVINETIFDKRFEHVPQLSKMGAKISVIKNNIHINGVTELFGTTVSAHDIRAGASLVLAGLVANGSTTVENAYQVLRGYENPMEKLSAIGADCKVVST
jgi:UDP-N-acetylglucosamine 1-carboxyvinyltransferase